MPIGFDLQMFDVVMIINLVLMGLIFTIPRWIAGLVIYLAVSGTLGVLRGTDTFVLFAKQFLGITISAIYFSIFFRHYRGRLDQVFLTYAKIAYWETVIAIGMYFCHYPNFVRLQGLFAEPMHYCILVLPAYYWYAYSYFTSGKNKTEFIVISVGVCLADSSIGFVSIAFGLMLLLSRRRRLLILVPIIVAVFVGAAYTLSSDFRLRLTDTATAAGALDVSGTNSSTYALISNLIVTRQVMAQHPLIGNGIGSHALSHERYLADIPGIHEFINAGEDSLNAADGDSLILRSLSELGLVGFSVILWFVFHFRVSGDGRRAAISSSILVEFFLKLLRHGHYFQPEQFFFIQIYIMNYRLAKQERSILAGDFVSCPTSQARRLPRFGRLVGVMVAARRFRMEIREKSVTS